MSEERYAYQACIQIRVSLSRVTEKSKKLLRVTYRIQQEGDFSRLFVCGPSRDSVAVSQQLAWIPMKRKQWFVVESSDIDLTMPVLEELKRTHPSALNIEIDSIEIMRSGLQHIQW